MLKLFVIKLKEKRAFKYIIQEVEILLAKIFPIAKDLTFYSS